MAQALRSLILIISLSFSCFLPCASPSWNLSEAGLPRDAFIWRFAVWRNRAFLAIPRWQKKAKLPSTLLEAPWPESGSIQLGITGAKISPFPNAECQPQESNDCRGVRSVTGLDVDARGRLWVLDAPDSGSDCRAKIVLYDLRRNDQEVTRNEFAGVSTKSLRCLVVDPVVGQWGSRAYIGDPEDESIIVYSLGQRRWWRLKLLHESQVPRVFSTDMAISRKNSMLYLTGQTTHDLFCVDLEESRNDEGPPAIMGELAVQNTSVSWLGEKLGSSAGLICDSRGGVHYFMITQRTSVRWDSKLESKAESYAVLLQREDVPCVTDYFVDAQRNVWGLVNPAECSFHDGKASTLDAKKPTAKEQALKHRTVKIYKYTPFAF